MTPSEAASPNGGSNGTSFAEAGVAGAGDVSTARDVVVVGASAGGVEALTRFVAALPADLAATVLVVLHIPARVPSALASILDRRGPLPARTARSVQPLERGVVLVAPPDHNLVVRHSDPADPQGAGGALVAAAVRGPRENGHRPCIDALFRTAAEHLGSRVVAVVLSGSDDDGTAGALAVRRRGGLVYAQAADEALYPTMPVSVAQRAGVEAQAPVAALAELVAAAVARPPSRRAPDPVVSPQGERDLAEEAAVDENLPEAVLGEPVGHPSGFVCPDCSGTLFTVTEKPVLRFRCRIGHAWTAEALVGQQAVTLETALWTAVRTLHERADLSERLANRALDDGRPVSARQFKAGAHDARVAARVLHELLAGAQGGEPLVAGPGEEDSIEDSIERHSIEANEAGRS